MLGLGKDRVGLEAEGRRIFQARKDDLGRQVEIGRRHRLDSQRVGAQAGGVLGNAGEELDLSALYSQAGQIDQEQRCGHLARFRRAARHQDRHQRALLVPPLG